MFSQTNYNLLIFFSQTETNQRDTGASRVNASHCETQRVLRSVKLSENRTEHKHKTKSFNGGADCAKMLSGVVGLRRPSCVPTLHKGGSLQGLKPERHPVLRGGRRPREWLRLTLSTPRLRPPTLRNTRKPFMIFVITVPNIFFFHLEFPK